MTAAYVDDVEYNFVQTYTDITLLNSPGGKSLKMLWIYNSWAEFPPDPNLAVILIKNMKIRTSS